MPLLKSLVRVTSFVRKELRELLRRPGAVLGLMIGPLAIMALFGVGYNGTRPPLEAIIVIPPGNDLPTDRAFYQQIVGDKAGIVAVTNDLEGARAELRADRADMLFAAPADYQQRANRGERSVVRVEWNEIDPIQSGLEQAAADYMVSRLNTEIIKRVAAQTLRQVDANGNPVNADPQAIAEPVKLETKNNAPVEPNVLWFFAPAVLALILQHVAVTLTALSLVRERISGAMELFRVSPIRPLEVLVGKYLAYSLFALVLTAIVTAGLVMLAGVPILGGWGTLVWVIAPFVFASLGLGLLLSLIADSERQAVQLSMIALLASVFFGGLVIPVVALNQPVREISYFLPVTHATLLSQNVMLRGVFTPVWSLWTLLALGGAFFVLSAFSLGRAMRAR